MANVYYLIMSVDGIFFFCFLRYDLIMASNLTSRLGYSGTYSSPNLTSRVLRQQARVITLSWEIRRALPRCCWLRICHMVTVGYWQGLQSPKVWLRDPGRRLAPRMASSQAYKRVPHVPCEQDASGPYHEDFSGAHPSNLTEWQLAFLWEEEQTWLQGLVSQTTCHSFIALSYQIR